MSNIEDVLMKEVKEMTEQGFRPSKQAVDFVKAIGPERIVNGLTHDFVSIKQHNINGNKSFDVIPTETLKNKVMDNLADKLESRGYRLTASGKEHILDYFSNPTGFNIKTIIGLQTLLPNGTKDWDEHHG
tara:strand:- start:683 stop:1072 length:390 start_codon:yes stop_codon:yes gene_type:complete